MTRGRQRPEFVRSMTFPEWLAYMSTPDAMAYGAGDSTIARSGGPGWTGGARDYAAAIQLARTGWAEGRAMVQRMALPLVDKLVPLTVPSARWEYDVTGAAYDVGEYLMGVPECWLAPQVEETKPVVSINLDCFLSAGVDPQVMKLRGAAMVALILALQQAGYAVQVSTTIGCDSTVNDEPLWGRVMLTDDGGGPLDTDRLLFMLAHPASVRWLMFTYASRMWGHDAIGYNRECYGATVSTPYPWDAPTLDIPKMSLAYGNHWSTEESTRRWVQETFDKLTKGGS